MSESQGFVFPSRIYAGTPTPVAYELRKQLYSIENPEPDERYDAIELLPGEGNTTYAIYQDSSGGVHSAERAGPVYSAGPDGPVAVPTGLIFVRLATGITPKQREKQFYTAGYAIERTPSYAPTTAWLRARTGGLRAALESLDQLKSIPGVEHVEPQLIMRRELKLS